MNLQQKNHLAELVMISVLTNIVIDDLLGPQSNREISFHPGFTAWDRMASSLVPFKVIDIDSFC